MQLPEASSNHNLRVIEGARKECAMATCRYMRPAVNPGRVWEQEGHG